MVSGCMRERDGRRRKRREEEEGKEEKEEEGEMNQERKGEDLHSVQRIDFKDKI